VLSCRTATVARPTAVRAVRIGPAQLKCCSHLSRRGWNGWTILPVCGSTPV